MLERVDELLKDTDWEENREGWRFAPRSIKKGDVVGMRQNLLPVSRRWESANVNDMGGGES